MSTEWVTSKGTKTKRYAEERLHRLLSMNALNGDSHFLEKARYEIPEAWHMLAMDIETTAPKEKITLYLDRSVAAMFRKMGTGYQARINRILETWMQMKMAEKEALRKSIIARAREALDTPERSELDRMLDENAEALMGHWAYEKGWHEALESVRGD